MVWLIGYKGMLGSQLCQTFTENSMSFIGSGSEVSVTDYSALKEFARGKEISFMVNCAAYTAVDKAESEAHLAFEINTKGAENLSRLASELKIPLIHVSTDYVFDGSSSSPLSEDEAISPLGVYGKSKADGEKAIMNFSSDYYILRTAWLYGFFGKNFVYTMTRAMNMKDSVKVVSDQFGSPTNCVTLSNVILEIIKKREGGLSVKNGIYHVTDLGEISWFDFAREIFSNGIKSGLITNKNCIINPCSTSEYPTPAKRPAYSVLDKSKIQKELKIKLPDWRESLSKFFNSERFDKTKIER